MIIGDCLAAMSHRPILPPLESRGRARRRCLAIASKFDALPSGEAADIKCGDMKAETGVVGWLVYRIVPAVMTPVDFGGTGQRDGKLGARMKFPDWRMRPPERITHSRSTPFIADGGPSAASIDAKPVPR